MRILILAALCLAAHAQTATVTVMGTIKDATGANFSGKVQIASTTYTVSGVTVGPTIATVTVTGGTFSQALYPGTYSVIYTGAHKNEKRTWAVQTSPASQTIDTIESTATATPVSTISHTLLSGLTLGDVLYGASTGRATRLAGNTAATKKYLVQTGTGTASAAPSWGTIAAGDIPDLSSTYAAAGHAHAGVYAALAHNHSGTYEPANANIQAHISSTSNPHAVTAAQAGALAAVAGSGALKVTDGAPSLVTGNASDCVYVDGSSGACGGAVTVADLPVHSPNAGEAIFWPFGPPLTPGGNNAVANGGVQYFQFAVNMPVKVSSYHMWLTTGAAADKGVAVGIMDSSCNLVAGSSVGGVFTTTGLKTLTLGVTITLQAGTYYLGLAGQTGAGAAYLSVTTSSYSYAFINAEATPRIFTGATAPTGTGASLTLPASCGARSVLSGFPVMVGLYP